MRSIRFVTLVVLALAGASVGHGWTLAECGPENAGRWSAFKKEMLKAAPGSPVYVPHPFPTTQEEVVRDFLYQYKEIWPDPSKLLAAERPLGAAITKGDMRFEMLRVDNWSRTRCSRDQERKSYFLVRIFDSAGKELARAALAESGLWETNAYATEGERAEPAALQARRLAPPAVATVDLHARFGVSGSSPQYVTAGGQVHCRVTDPCLAVRAGSSVFLLSQDELFEIPAKARRARFDETVGPRAEANARGLWEMADSVGPEERLIGLGGGTYVVARRVGKGR